MQSTRFLVQRLSVDGVAVETSYADLYVVVRDGFVAPGPTDWEAQAKLVESRHISPGRHILGFDIADGSHLVGEAIVRASNGNHHLFRGDGDLAGFTADPS